MAEAADTGQDGVGGLRPDEQLSLSVIFRVGADGSFKFISAALCLLVGIEGWIANASISIAFTDHMRGANQMKIGRSKRISYFRCFAGCLLSTFSCLSVARSSNYSWTGGSGSPDWIFGANWQGGTAPPNDGTADINFNSGTLTSNISTNYFIAGIAFTGSYTINGVGLTLTIGQDGLSMIGAGGNDPSETINCGVRLGANQTWNLESNLGAASLTLNGGVDTAGHVLTFAQTPNVIPATFTGAITGSGSIQVAAGSAITFNGANTYTGSTTLTGSLVTFTNPNALSSTSALSLIDGGGGSELIIGSTQTFTKPASVSGFGEFSAAAGVTFTLSGTLSVSSGGTLGFGDYSNPGTVVANIALNGSSLSNFSIYVYGGTLRNGNATLGTFSQGVFSQASVIMVAGGTTYDLNGFGVGTSDLEGGGTISSASPATFAAAAGNFSGTINGAVALAKTGTGTLTLTGNNNFTGGTTVSGGTLLVNGINSGKGTVTVQNSGSVLGGTGTILAQVNVTTGMLNPGNNAGAAGSAANAGKLSVGALTLSSTATSVFDINSGTTYDQLSANGNIALGGSTLTLNVASSSTAYTVGQTLDLFHANGGVLSGTFSNFNNLGSYTYGGDTFLATYTPTDFTLTVTSVPEPATWAGGALLLAGAGGMLRRRLHRA